MGLSVSCARCHDHKFDPVPTEDYYSLHGVFASSVEPGELPLLPTPVPEVDKASYDAERQARLDAAAHARAARRAEIEKELRNHLAAFVEASFALDFNPQHPKLDEVARAHKVSPERLKFAARRLGKLFDKDGDPNDPMMGPWVRFARLPEAEFAARQARSSRRWPTRPTRSTPPSSPCSRPPPSRRRLWLR